jgi:hypothetical protein
MTSLLCQWVVPVPDLDGRNAILYGLTGPASLISDQSKVDVYVLFVFYALVACSRDVYCICLSGRFVDAGDMFSVGCGALIVSCLCVYGHDECNDEHVVPRW